MLARSSARRKQGLAKQHCRGTEHGHVADPGPQEKQKIPSPPGGTGHRQVAVGAQRPGEHSSGPQLGHSCLMREKRLCGAQPALSLSLTGAQDTRRSQQNPREQPPITSSPGEVADLLPCHEFLSGLGCVPKHWSCS